MISSKLIGGKIATKAVKSEELVPICRLAPNHGPGVQIQVPLSI